MSTTTWVRADVAGRLEAVVVLSEKRYDAGRLDQDAKRHGR